MSQITIGEKLPTFSLPVTNHGELTNQNLKGKNVVLYFYPRDNTPGCTQEGLDFSRHHADFLANDTVVYGISRDSVKKHENFKTKQCFPFELISDEEELLCGLFGVMVNKNMYGKKVRGIERSTFLFDKKGILKHEWRKVKIDGHVEDVLNKIKELA